MTKCSDAEKAALVETQQERNAAVESYEGMRHSWYTEHNALLEAQGKLEAIAALARQGQYVWVSALDRISPAQGKETADIETLREMVHAFYEGGRPITKEQLDAFCAVGPSDTSPAALLAQGERLRSFRDELRGTPGNSVGPFQWIADRLDSILEEDTRLGMSRAALSGEETE